MAVLKFELVKDITILENEWNSLVSRMKEPEIFYTYGWINNYLKYYDSGIDPYIVVGKTGTGEIVCIFPFAYYNETLEFITREATDYNTIFIDAGYNRYYITKKAIGYLLDTIKVQSIRLLNMKGNSELFMLQDILKNYGFSTVTKMSSMAPYLPLDIASAKMQKKELKDIERREKKLKAEHTVTFETRHKFENDTINFIQYHRKKKYGDDSFDNEHVLEFYKHLTEDLCSETVVNQMYVDGTLAAVHFGFCMANKFYYYIPTTDEQYSQNGIGLILLKHIVEENQGRVFDFLRGNEVYKFYWCDDIVMNFNLLAYRKNKEGLIPLMVEKLKNDIRIRKLFRK